MEIKQRSVVSRLLLALCVAFFPALLTAQDNGAESPAEAEPEPPPPDVITTVDGSRYVGTVKQMTDGKLTIATESGGEVTVTWADVESLELNQPLPFVLHSDTRLPGTATTNAQGELVVDTVEVAGGSTFALDQVKAINPPEEKPIKYRGNLSAGVTINDGNTRTKSGALTGEFVARSKRQRLSLRGAYNYAEDEGELTARNGKAGMKYDFFASERLFVYASSFFEYDKFQDLDLRTALSAGPGYQFYEAGDLEPEFLRTLELYGELGISYVDENRSTGEDDQYMSGRWAVDLNWGLVPDKVTFFHHHEGFPGLERGDDIFVTTEQGLRFQLMSNLIATIQVNWKWDNTPSPGFRRSDTLYLFTLGYNFDL